MTRVLYSVDCCYALLFITGSIRRVFNVSDKRRYDFWVRDSSFDLVGTLVKTTTDNVLFFVFDCDGLELVLKVFHLEHLRFVVRSRRQLPPQFLFDRRVIRFH